MCAHAMLSFSSNHAASAIRMFFSHQNIRPSVAEMRKKKMPWIHKQVRPVRRSAGVLATGWPMLLKLVGGFSWLWNMDFGYIE